MGEFGGGKVILEILRKRQIVDVVVVVTRWYGGIHLSSDRFKHIKTLTAAIIDQEKIKPNTKYSEHLKGSTSGSSPNGNGNGKPIKKNVERGQQIANRLYWSDGGSVKRSDVFIGCKCKEKKLHHHVIEINLDEYGVQKSGIE